MYNFTVGLKEKNLMHISFHGSPVCVRFGKGYGGVCTLNNVVRWDCHLRLSLGKDINIDVIIAGYLKKGAKFEYMINFGIFLNLQHYFLL